MHDSPAWHVDIDLLRRHISLMDRRERDEEVMNSYGVMESWGEQQQKTSRVLVEHIY